MTHEENLLFAAFAVQMSMITAPEALEATAAWATDPSMSIADRLVEKASLTNDSRATLDAMVARAARDFGGNTRKALDAAVEDVHAYGRYFSKVSLSGERPDDISTIPASAAFSKDTPTTPIAHETPGRYKGQSEYARGGMGRVLLVHDAHLGRDIAMKELLPNVSHSGETLSIGEASPVRLSVPLISRFLQEARITGQLEHPSIVPVYELGHRRSGQLYYTMKLVRGRTLARTIRAAKRLTDRLALLSHFTDLCQAIAYAHSRNVLHRDIKPSNIMVGEFGETVVLDWGLAKFQGEEDVHEKGFALAVSALNLGGENELAKTEYGQIVGTPAYMAPEQAQGHLDRVDERSDVYSLGAVLFEILTGTTPHEGKTKQELLHNVATKPPRHVNDIDANAPPELAAICEKALKKDHSERYQSARELADDVQRFQSGVVVRAHAYSPLQLLQHFYRRYRTRVWTAAAVLLVAALGLAYFNMRLYESREAERAQRLIAEDNNSRLLDEAYASTTVAAQGFLNGDNVERALDYLERSPESRRGWEWGHLRRACNPMLSEAPHDLLKVDTAMPVRCCFSDNGRQVISKWNSGGVITIYDREQDEYIYYSDIEEFLGFPHTTNFGPDPGHITAGVNYTTVAYYDWVNGNIVRTFAVESGWLWTFLVSPDGKYATGGTFDMESGARGLIVWDFQSGAEIRRVSLPPREHPGYEGVPPQYVHYHIASTYPFGVIRGYIDDSRKVVFSDDNVCVLDIETGAVERKMDCHAGIFDVLPERGWVVFVRPDGTVGQWDLVNDAPLADLEYVENAIELFYSGGEEPRIAAREGQHRWAVWDATTGAQLNRYQSDTLSLFGLDLADTEPVAVTLASNSHLQFWEVGGAKVREPLPLMDENGQAMEHDVYLPYAWPYRSYAIHPNRSMMAIQSSDNEVRLWRVPEMTLVRRWRPHEGKISEMGFSMDGNLMTTCSWDGYAAVWDVETGVEIHRFAPEFDEACFTAAITPDNQSIALGYGERSTEDRAQSLTLFYDLKSSELVERVDLAGNRINKLAYTPDGELLFAGVWGLNGSDHDSFVIYRSSDLSEPVARVKGIGWGGKVKFDKDGTHALLHSGALNPVYFDIERLEVVYEVPNAQAMTIDFHPDGDRFVGVAHITHQANIYRASDGRLVASLDRSLGPAFFSADGTELYTLKGGGKAQIFRSDPWK